MQMKFSSDSKKGEITAFLSLVLLLILSLVGTVIEGARVYVANAYTKRALTTAMDSALGEYFYPLYEDYHLFFLDSGYGMNDANLSQLEENVKEYMDFSLNPARESKLLGQKVSMPGMNLYDITIDHITVEDTIGATELENKMFIHEAVGFMKYKLPLDFIEAIGKNHMNSNTSVQITKIMDKKMNLEESACILSENMLDLIRYIEGISVDKKGIHYKGNLLKTESNFVKKFCVGEINKSNLNISHDIVFHSLKNSYKTPVIWLEEIIEWEKDIKEYIKQIEGLENELLNSDEKENEPRKSEIISTVNQCEKEKKKALKNVKSHVSKIINLSKGTQEKINAALKVLPTIEESQEKASKEAKLYEEYLDENKEKLDENLYHELEQDSGKMKDYINNLGENTEYNLSRNRLDAIQNALEHNSQLLDKVYGIEDITINESMDNINQMISLCTNLKSSLYTYNTKDLWFDYSSLNIDPDVENPVNHFKELINKGILDLVVKDLESISKSKLTGLDLLSKTNHEEKETYKEETFCDSISNYNEKNHENKLKSIFGEIGAKEEKKLNQIKSGDTLLETILLNEYMIEHFKNQGNVENEKIEKETLLEYEQEYILFGNLNDYDNLSQMIHKLLFTRTIMNFVYLFTDKEKSGLAYSTAAALIGFTCLEPLISLTKTIILLVWAYEEAFIDTSGLLENKYVPFLKNKKTFLMNYNELFLMNKQLIQDKVKKLSNEKLTILDLNYDEYIRIFLYLTDQNTICRRAMDLIQENIRYRYEENFLIQNCIFGFGVKADYHVGAKFIKLPFVNRLLNRDVNGYGYHIKKEYSY